MALFPLQCQIAIDYFEMTRRRNLLDEVLLAFKFIDCDFDECSDTSDSEDDRLNRRERVQRMIPFYEDRMDIFFEYFDDIQLVQAFRFNRSGIKYITGMFCHLQHCFIALNSSILSIHRYDCPVPAQKEDKGKKKVNATTHGLIVLDFYSTGVFQRVVGNVVRCAGHRCAGLFIGFPWPCHMLLSSSDTPPTCLL